MHAFVAQGGTGQHRHNMAGQGRFTQDSFEHFRCNVLTLQVALGQFHGALAVQFGQGLDHLLAALRYVGLQFLGYGADGRIDVILATVNDGLLGDQIDHTAKVAFLAHGHLDRNGLGAQALDDGVNGAPVVGTHAVHFVHKTDAGHAVAVGLPPYRL